MSTSTSTSTSKYRTFEERQKESLNIIFNLRKNGYTSKDKPVRDLLDKLTEYMKTGENMNFEIPYYKEKKMIVGKLYKSRNVPCEVVLRHRPNMKEPSSD